MAKVVPLRTEQPVEQVRPGMLTQVIDRAIDYLTNLRTANAKHLRTFQNYRIRKRTVVKDQNISRAEKIEQIKELDQRIRYPIAAALQDEANVLKSLKDHLDTNNIDQIEKDLVKREKKAPKSEKLTKKQILDKDEFILLLNYLGPDNTKIETVTKGKKIRYKGNDLAIEGCSLAAAEHAYHIRFEGHHEWLRFKNKNELERILVGLTKKAIVEEQPNAMSAEHVVKYIKKAQEILEPAQLLERLRGATIVEKTHRVRIDNYTREGYLHIHGYPADIWVPLKANNIRIAIENLRAAMEININLIKHKPLNISSLSDIMRKKIKIRLGELKPFGFTDHEIEIIELLRKNLTKIHV